MQTFIFMRGVTFKFIVSVSDRKAQLISLNSKYMLGTYTSTVKHFNLENFKPRIGGICKTTAVNIVNDYIQYA